MIVLSVTNCPQQLRGDLTKWLIEIDVGVYVGRLNARVRERIWERVCDNIQSGKAIMVYSSNNEQGFQILTYNTEWKPMMCEGLWLMQKPCNKDQKTNDNTWKESTKAKLLHHYKKPIVEKRKDYVILDIETTGLDVITDSIIEIGMLKIENNKIAGEFHVLVNPNKKLSEEIIRLTGISQEMLEENGKDSKCAIEEAACFARNNLVVGYNLDFDIKFLNKLCEDTNAEKFIYRSKDILRIVRRKVDLCDYRLETVARKCDIDVTRVHRALEDCRILFGIITKLNLF
ncbi:MAG: type I-E CRISPR-associated endoribonuclease Cas2e [Acetatifactor sp.]